MDAGWAVDVLAMRRPGERAEEVVDGARVIRLPLTHRRGAGAGGVLIEYLGFALLSSLRAAVEMRRRRYSVVHVHGPPDFLVAASLLPRLSGARTILDIHDLSPDMVAARFGARKGAGAVDVLLRAGERLATRLAHAVITVHEPYRGELVRRGVPREKVTVVMNSLDERLVDATAGPGAAKGGFRVVYHGTVTPSYGLELLVRAIALVRDDIPGLSAEIYGEGDAVEPLRAQASSLGVGDCVLVSGSQLPHADVLERIGGASAGVIPNRPTRLNRFALSSKLFEYVALGIPVVSADLPTIRAHFSDEEVRFFTGGNADSLAEALLEIAADPQGAADRAERARRRYEDYRWPAQAERYARLLGSLVGH